MKTRDFIARLQQFRPDMEIEIECPNGLMVEPSIKLRHINDYDPFSEVISYVISWQD